MCRVAVIMASLGLLCCGKAAAAGEHLETVALGQQLRVEAIPPDVRERLETFMRSRLTRTS
jgi:hypothetical protein